MRRRGAPAGVLAAATLVLSLTCCGRGDEAERPADWRGPIAAVDAAEHDFGDVFAHQQRRHVFRVTNAGHEELVVRDVEVDCGCTVPVLDREVAAPGETIALTLDFRPPALGAVKKRIRVFTNDPWADPLVLTILAKGHGRMRLDPPALIFDGEVPPEGLETELTIEVADDRTIAEATVAPRCPWLHVTPVPSDDPRRARFSVRLMPPPAPLATREPVSVLVRTAETDRALPPMLPFELIARVEPQLRVEPPVLVLRAAASDEASGRVELRGDFGEAPAAIAVSDARFAVEPLGDGFFRVRRIDPAGPDAAHVRFVRRDGAAALLRVLVREPRP